MHNRIERVKTHIQENKKFYIGATAGVAVGSAVMYYLFKTGTLYVHWDDVPKTTNTTNNITNKAKELTFIMNENYQCLSLHGVGNVGRPGIMVKDLETKIVYPSITAAAKATGLNVNSIARCVQGKQDHVSGHRFVKVFVDAWHPGEIKPPEMEVGEFYN